MNTISNNISKRAHNSVLRLIAIIVILALSMTGCSNSEEKGGGDYPKEHTAPDITLNIEESEDIIDNIADNTVDNADNIDNSFVLCWTGKCYLRIRR